ncbi:MAG: hypothetical protein LUF90_04035 [Rikenellaceae bacterium]|nr:hypothetical protein [Rikenellaceae bacterium]
MSTLIKFFTDITLINKSGGYSRIEYILDPPVRFYQGNSYPMEPEDLVNPVPNLSGSATLEKDKSQTLVIYNNRNFNFNGTTIDKIEAVFSEIIAQTIPPENPVTVKLIVEDENGNLLKSATVERDGNINPDNPLKISVDTADVSPQNKWVVHIEVIKEYLD